MKHFRWYLISFLITLLLGFSYTSFKYHESDLKLRNDLTDYLSTVRVAINPELITQLAGDESDLKNPSYSYLQKLLTRLVTTYPDSHFLYIMKLDGDKVKFVVDSQSDLYKGEEELAIPGEIYENAQDSLLKLFSTNAIISVGPETDKWGTFVSGLGSITNSEGKIIGVIGIDIDAHTWQEIILKQTVEIIIFFILLYIVEILIIIQYLQYKKHQDTISYLATVLDYSHDAIISYDTDGIIKSWNQGAVRIFEYPEQEAIGQKITNLIYLDNKKSEFDYIISTIKTGQNISQYSSVRKNKSGKLIGVLVTASPIYKNNQVVAVSVVYKDITAENNIKKELIKRNQELEKINSLFVNRELRMVELKKKITELESHL